MAALTRRQQREKTRQHLLEAAVACLVEFGYAGTTTQRVQDRAGVSRGALLHHFSSKAELLVASIHHIADERLEVIRQVTDSITPGPQARPEVVAAIGKAMSGPPFIAALELWVSSRTDPELRAELLPAERALGRALWEIFIRAEPAPSHETKVAFDSLLIFLRGLAVTEVLRADPGAAEDAVRYWIDHMDPAPSVGGPGEA